MSLTFALEQSSRQLRDLLRAPSTTLKATMLTPTTLLGGSPTSLVMTSKGEIWTILHNHTLVKITSQGLISSIVGKRGISGYKDGSILEALFDFGFWLSGIGELQSGDIIFTDPSNHRIRLLGTGESTISTIAGTGGAGFLDGPAEQAIFNHPASLVVAFDQSIFIADVSNRCLRRLLNGVVTTISEAPEAGKAFDPELLLPSGLAYSPKGQLIVADSLDHSICRVTHDRVTCLAGSTKGYMDGAIDEARMCSPAGLALTPAGDLLVCDAGNHAVRILMEGRISTVFAPKDIPALSRDSQTPGCELTSVWPRAIVLGPDATMYLADLQGIVLLSGPAQFTIPLPDDMIRSTDSLAVGKIGALDSPIAITIQQHLVPLADVLSRQLTMIDIRLGMLKLVRTTSLLLHQCSLHISKETGDRSDSFKELIARTVSIMHDVSTLILNSPASELVVKYLQLLRECYLSFLMFF